MIRKIELDGKIVGQMNLDNFTYITNRIKSKHLMRKFNGYGISETVLNHLKKYNIKKILILTDNGEYRFMLNQYLDTHLIYIEGENDAQMFVRLEEAKC